MPVQPQCPNVLVCSIHPLPHDLATTVTYNSASSVTNQLQSNSPSMALLKILEFPDPRLRTKAKPVAEVNDDIRSLVNNMFETMYAAPGIGLAATQVDVHQQVIVMDLSEDKNEPLVFINPDIVEKNEIDVMQEGCLSVPDIFADVKRAHHITVRALDVNGEPFELEARDLLAVCIQHEMDHLAGKLFVDYLSPLKREMVKKKLLKRKKRKA